MNVEAFQFFSILSNGLAALWILAQMGGLCVCLMYRRLSGRLIVAAVGFAGLILGEVLGRIPSLGVTALLDWVIAFYLVSSVLGLVSTLILVAGLYAALNDIRRQLAIALEPPHARR